MTKILILNPEDWRRFVEAQNSKLKQSFKPFEIEAKTVGDMVSRKQQSYIFGAIYPRLKEALIDAGYRIQNLTENQFDYFMREMFYSDIIVTSKGEKKSRVAYAMTRRIETKSQNTSTTFCILLRK